jgi:nucleoside-diphosphate-sugar epimerase
MKNKTQIAIAGASGFIGTALCRELAHDYNVVAITRSPTRSKIADPEVPVTWRHCDPFSMREVELALSGAEYLIYLVHNRGPSARLDQAGCQDMDVLISDNFARAAHKNNIKQILYFGFLIPQGKVPQEIIMNRQEVPQTLARTGTPVTTLRAGLVVGPGGTGLRLLANCVTRTPVIFVPRWALSKKQPIALSDVIRALRFCLGNSETYGQQYDIGGPQIINFREMLQEAVDILGKKRLVFTFPFCPEKLYRALIRLLNKDIHSDLIRIAIEGLRFDMVVKDNLLQKTIVDKATTIKEALTPYLGPQRNALLKNPRSTFRPQDDTEIRTESRVRSIQRLKLPAGRNAQWMAENYFSWLPNFLQFFVIVDTDSTGSYRFYLRFPRLLLLHFVFKPQHSTPNRRMYFIGGGLMAKILGGRTGRMEFRDVLDGKFTIAALHDFNPSMPWIFYVLTQALIHKLSMKIFQKHLEKISVD